MNLVEKLKLFQDRSHFENQYNVENRKHIIGASILIVLFIFGMWLNLNAYYQFHNIDILNLALVSICIHNVMLYPYFYQAFYEVYQEFYDNDKNKKDNGFDFFYFYHKFNCWFYYIFFLFSFIHLVFNKNYFNFFIENGVAVNYFQIFFENNLVGFLFFNFFFFLPLLNLVLALCFRIKAEVLIYMENKIVKKIN